MRHDCGGHGEPERKMRVVAFAAMFAVGTVLAGCAPPERGPAVPRADTERALPLGLADARFYPDGATKPFLDVAAEALKREIAALPAGANPRRLPPAYYLAVSGGGGHGAFGRALRKRRPA